MKLINKISLWFIGIVLIITPLTMFISQSGIRHKIIEFESKRLESVNNHVLRLLAEQKPISNFTRDREIIIEKFDGPVPATNPQIRNELRQIEGTKDKELALYVTNFQTIHGKNYKVTSHNYLVNPSAFFNNMMVTLLWKMLIVAIATFIWARLFSKHLLDPFKNTIEAIRHFSVRKKQPLRLERSSTKEFNELNCFIEKMTHKVLEEYTIAREFSENASHELQTPLAVLRSKTELLTQTNLDVHQAELIEHMQTEINKLSGITRSLVLLARLENEEFNMEKNVKVCQITKNVIQTYESWAELKNITITQNTEKDVYVNTNPNLMEILISNLLRNAIKYNSENGLIIVELTHQYLRMKNTGTPISIPHKDIFKRFKKGNQCNEGVGLGLAIVKQICDNCFFKINYTYDNNWHTFEVDFPPILAKDHHSKSIQAHNEDNSLVQLANV